jgi:inner membrane protein
VASHIGADVITAYGTAVFHPLSRQRFSLGSSFVVDPLFTAIVLAGLGWSLRSGRRLAAVAGLAVLGLYVAGQFGLQRRAIEIGSASAQAQGLRVEAMAALAQPFSPFNWKLVGVGASGYQQAHLNIAGHPPLVPDWPGLHRLHAIAAAYRPPAQLAWQRRDRHGEGEEGGLVEGLWNEPRFAPFRRFAVYPAISSAQDAGAGACVWFTDLRYDLPALPDTFRYGFCREGADSPWDLYRLRYFSEANRQRLSP